MFVRRQMIAGAACMALAGKAVFANGIEQMEETYGLIGQMMAAPGKRDELIGYLLAGTGDMPGNLAYIIAEDLQDPDSIWITEVWRTRTDHENSLSLPSVQDAIAKARPILAGFGTRVETRPVGFAG